MVFLLLGFLACVGAFDLRSQEYGHMEYHEGGFGRYEGHDQDWGYNYENGPNTWRVKYPRCAGYKQSPIALPAKPHHIVHAKPVTYKNFNIPQPALLRNTGTALELELMGINSLPMLESTKMREPGTRCSRLLSTGARTIPEEQSTALKESSFVQKLKP